MSVPAAELVIVGHYDMPRGYGTRRRTGSPSWMLMWTQQGSGHIEQGATTRTTSPGDLVVLASNTPHSYRTADDHWRFWWIHFQPRQSWLPWLAPHTAGPGYFVIPGLTAARVDETFLRAHADARWTGHGLPPAPTTPTQAVVATAAEARELVLGAVETVLLLATAGARPAHTGDARIRHAQELITADPAAPHTVASLARAVALSPSRFAHLFTETTGRSPMTAVREARVRHAARLLEVTDLDIGQVATASGFASPFHFSRIFSREFGVPPRSYRATLREGP
ncbi:helix-turn-helix domain-containing protein [Nonomuraea sp. NPDC050663]|uniref:helix-turn-helix domain-containing protein n=1 Tax=Nonomuraea sp. NPDC050663 TaxID=3364370 RepID=UPI0037BC7E0A